MALTNLSTDTYRETRDVAVRDLVHYPGNSRRGDVDAIRASLRKQGQYRALIVRLMDDGTLIVLAGNHTLKALVAEKIRYARCEIHVCDDDTARRINIADNKIANLGTWDDDALAEQLSYMDGEYDGTGYSEDDVMQLLDGWVGGRPSDEHQVTATTASGRGIGEPAPAAEQGIGQAAPAPDLPSHPAAPAPPPPPPPGPLDEFPDYDESVAKTTKMVACPECSHSFPIG